MQGLARAQQGVTRQLEPKPQPVAPRTPRQPARSPFVRAASVTARPKTPDLVDSPLEKTWRFASQRRLLAVGGVSIAIMTAVLIMTSGPNFVPGAFPATFLGQPRPLPINPNAPITFAFGALGAKAPKSNPESSRLMRYTYGSDLAIDAVNSIIYSITLRIPNRSWGGLNVGMPERTAMGALARLGVPQQQEQGSPPPERIGNYQVYRSLDSRPRRVVRAEIRPPNGCYDVQVDLQPRAIGILADGDRRYAVVARGNGSPEWVVTQIRVVSRSLRGPYTTGRAC